MPDQPIQQAAAESAALADWEVSMIDVFVRAARLIGLPRSIGEIYGLLYVSDRPVYFDAVCARLGISRGSASEGLKTLRHIGAIKLHYQPGERKNLYVPELSMERLARGFFKDQVVPHFESSTEHLAHMPDLIAAEPDAARRQHASARLQTLHTWQSRAQKLFPLVLAVLSGAKHLADADSPGDGVVV